MIKNGLTKKCISCETCFYIPKSRILRASFCSHRCHSNYLIGKKLKKEHIDKIKKSKKGFRHTKETAIKIGLANKIVYSDLEKRKEISERQKRNCYFKDKFGNKSARWISDRTKLKKDRLKMYDTKYKYWMLEVKNRDCWKCKINNKDCKGRLEAHHILGWQSHPELRYQVNNGITLCHAHHPKKRAEEKRLSPYFKDLVSVSND